MRKNFRAADNTTKQSCLLGPATNTNYTRVVTLYTEEVSRRCARLMILTRTLHPEFRQILYACWV